MSTETKQQQQSARDTAKSPWLPEFTPASDIVRYAVAQTAGSAAGEEQEGYYGVPMLKQPKWGWEIALYFFCEGVSSGSFLMATLAELTGKGRYRRLSHAGYYTSFMALLPCPPLLIADLGRPERFHHMLRVFKPTSPMNLGAWALAGYSLPLTLIAGRQLTWDGPLSFEPLKSASKLIPARLLGLLGIPFALTMISYPGVLLSTTSTPVWSKSRFVGALIACSSVSTGAAAVSLALSRNGDRPAQERLEKIENLARLCEGAALAAYLTTAGDAARPLTEGHYKWHFWLGAVGAGLILPTLVGARGPSKEQKKSRASTVIKSALTLAGGLALKWAIVYAGKRSAVDVEATRNATRPSESAPGWVASKQTASQG